MHLVVMIMVREYDGHYAPNQNVYCALTAGAHCRGGQGIF